MAMSSQFRTILDNSSSLKLLRPCFVECLIDVLSLSSTAIQRKLPLSISPALAIFVVGFWRRDATFESSWEFLASFRPCPTSLSLQNTTWQTTWSHW